MTTATRRAGGRLDRWIARPRPLFRPIWTHASAPAIDPAQLRDILGHFATGVVVVTAYDGAPIGMTCQSFTSLSLDPPLVSLSPSRSSTSWPRIRRAHRFCVNVLAADQASLSARFAISGGDKFADVRWRPAPSGAPILDGGLVWVECELRAEYDGGDHFLVVGEIDDLGTGDAHDPLLFHRGFYRELAASGR